MKAELEKLYEHIEDVEIAMMTTRRPDGHLQSRAMATQKRAEGADLWFVTLEGGQKLHDVRPDLLGMANLAAEHHDALVAAASDGNLWELYYTGVPAPEGMAAGIEAAGCPVWLKASVYGTKRPMPFTVHSTPRPS